MKFTKPLLSILSFFIAGCAGVVPPTGGPKDEKPPVVIKQSPGPNTTNFTSNKITFTFNEYVVLNDIANQFIISPPLQKAPKIIIRGKRVEVQFEEELKANTTYTLNFGNSILDNNEANILEGLTYTFSTGAYIDSLELRGTVLDGYTLAPQKDIAVGLYEKTEDSTIFKTKPSYFQRPDAGGHFTFKYLRPGDYELVAFEDVNKNLKIEPFEKIAFRDSIIHLDYTAPDSGEYRLLLSKQYNVLPPQFLSAKELSKGTYQFITTGSNCAITVEPYTFDTTSHGGTSLLLKNNCDTVYYYTNLDCKDTSVFLVTVANTPVDTITINCKSNKYKKFEYLPTNNIGAFNYLDSIRLSFATPIIQLFEDEVVLLKDSIPVQGFKVSHSLQDPLNLYIVYNYTEATNYTVVVPAGILKDVFGQQNDSIKTSVTTAAADTYGNLSIKVVHTDSVPYIVELKDKDDQTIHTNTINTTRVINYKNLVPGQYRIKIIRDENRNNSWDHGSYFENKQPESIYFSEGTIDLRANWEITDIVVTPVF